MVEEEDEDHQIDEKVKVELNPQHDADETVLASERSTAGKTITKLDKTLTCVQSHLNGFIEPNELDELMERLRLTYH